MTNYSRLYKFTYMALPTTTSPNESMHQSYEGEKKSRELVPLLL